ncbi:Methionine aminopeptidase 2-2 [Aspergillus mulundensis]|uniref:Methionine aminopeptidase 2 n=1 Tax=Aspergillus mulundensis TaxID=1810919 RepID=A0A3D8R9S7_9EURO|nr:Methionine aminopeptidase 2-2 [Aspergillus mulundensis]RDW70710.1 Methionine aminopeptidase 2-2 [Aspergillus mulundensis]
MGSKTPEKDGPNGRENTTAPIESPSGGMPRGVHLATDGDGAIGDSDDDEDGEAHQTALTNATPTGNQKKKRKSKKKSKKKAVKQSSPPRVPLSQLFPQGKYPVGEVQEYQSIVDNASRTTGEELRYLSRRHLEDDAFLNDYRKAAEVHRQVRKWTQEHVKPGQGLMEIAEDIDDGVRALLGHAGLEPGDSLKAGLGFPTGLSLNNVVAHYTPNPGQKDIILKSSDVMKVDFGVHINGWIVDSAFTMSFDPVYDNLLAAVKDATNTGLKTAGIDVRISDVSAAIQEAMESYEVEIGGKTFPVKAVRNITGHNIQHYRIHGGKSIPFVKNSDQTKMEEGEIFAIETFGSTGRGYIHDDVGVYGYGKSYDAPSQVSLPLASARSLYKTINENFDTIVFCRRQLDRLGLQRYLAGMNTLVQHGVVDVYAPLVDVKGSYSAQFEHTVLLRESNKEVISRGDDY